MSPLGTLVRPFILICVLRLGPQHLPQSWSLLLIALLANTFVGALLVQQRSGIYLALLVGASGALMLGILSASVLLAVRRMQRLRQTLCALAGCGALIGLMWYLLNASLGILPDPHQLPLAALLLFTAVAVWDLAVSAHILRHALSVPFFIGLAVAVVFYLLQMQLFDYLFNHLYFPDAF